jgi:hypothetical protein
VGKFTRVSKRWKQITEDNQLWIRFCGSHVASIQKGESLKAYYVVCAVLKKPTD